MRRLGKIKLLDRTILILWDNYYMNLPVSNYFAGVTDFLRDANRSKFGGYITLKHIYAANDYPQPAELKKLRYDHSYFDAMNALNYEQVKNIVYNDLAFIQRCCDNENF